MTCYDYIESEYDVTKPLLDIINEYGERGFRFVTMAQKIDSKVPDFRTGQPKITITLIFERQYQSMEVQPSKQN